MLRLAPVISAVRPSSRKRSRYCPGAGATVALYASIAAAVNGRPGAAAD
jgi:hypothetical protein